MNSIYRSGQGKEEVLNFYREMLDHWPCPLTMHQLNTSLGLTSVMEWGESNAPALLLLHGSSSNSLMWMGDAAIFGRNYHVFSIDIPGECGMSDKTRIAFSPGTHAAWLVEIMTLLELTTVYLVSNSLGSWIALDLAIRYPQRVEKLVLLAAAGLTPIRPSALFWIIFTSLTGRWGFNILNRKIYGSIPMDSQALAFASLVKKHFLPRTEILPVFDGPELGKICCPVLYMGGDHDLFYNSQKAANHLEGNVSGARAEVLENTGHVLVNLSRNIIEFLTDN